MKRTRHTAEQIIRKLKTAEQLIAQGKTVVEVCRVIEVTQPTYHRWRQQYGGMQAEEARRLTQLEKENARLKKLLAEAELEKAMPKDLVALQSAPRGATGPFWFCKSVTGHESARPAAWWGSTAAQQHPAPSRQGCLHRGGKAPASSAGDRR